MGQLRDKLLHPAVRARLVTDCEALVGDEVARKSGLTGIAVKAAYGAVNRFGPGFVAKAIDKRLLDPFVDSLEPFALAAQSAGQALGDYLPQHAEQVADALLGVTDRQMDRVDNAVLKKIYGGLRGMGSKHVVAAVPGIARTLSPYLT